MQRRKVDLPPPLGPRITSTWPSRIAGVHALEHLELAERLPDVLGQHHRPTGGLPAGELSGAC